MTDRHSAHLHYNELSWHNQIPCFSIRSSSAGPQPCLHLQQAGENKTIIRGQSLLLPIGIITIVTVLCYRGNDSVIITFSIYNMRFFACTEPTILSHQYGINCAITQPHYHLLRVSSQPQQSKLARSQPHIQNLVKWQSKLLRSYSNLKKPPVLCGSTLVSPQKMAKLFKKRKIS